MAATVESIADIVRWKLLQLKLMAGLLEKYGLDAVESAIQQTGECHQGCEEIGSSDINHMVDGTLRSLGEPGLWESKSVQ